MKINSAFFNLLIFHSKNHKILTYHWSKTIESGEKIAWWNVFLQWMLATIIGKFSSLIQKQTMQIQLSDTTGTSMALPSMVRWNWKEIFWLQTHQMSLVQTGIKQYAMSTVKYTAESLILWACFFLPEVLNILFGCIASWIQQIKNQNLTASVKNLWHPGATFLSSLSSFF